MDSSDSHPVYAHHEDAEGSVAQRKAYLQSLLNIQKVSLRARTRSRTLSSLIVSCVAVVAGVLANMDNSWEELSTGIAVSILVAMVLPAISFIASYWEETIINRRLHRGMEWLIQDMEDGDAGRSDSARTTEQKIAIQALIVTEQLKYRFSRALREGRFEPL